MSVPWKELLSQGRLVPHFQPIISLESLRITAYEALGRHCLGEEVRSLGPFFEAGGREPGLAGLRKDVDRTIRREALLSFARWGGPEMKLFLNVNPRLMAEHLTLSPGEIPWTLQMIAELGIDPKRIVIELTEEAVETATSALRKMVDLYRAHGCGIAVDDVGAESSNLDRIGAFEPDIIKIDAAMLRRSHRHRSFQQVLKGVSSMANGLGAALLFEGIETEADLAQSHEFGARYAQGWYFAKAEAEPLAADSFTSSLKSTLVMMGRRRSDAGHASKQRIRETMEALGRPPAPVRLDQGWWGFPLESLELWGLPACRIFLTDWAGFQVSPNYEAVPGGWNADTSVLGWCRSMRPYFPGGGDARWTVSETYFDANDRRLMRTYSRPAGTDLILYVDVPEIEKPSRSG